MSESESAARNTRPVRFSHWFGYVGFRGAEALVSAMSAPMAFRFGELIGRAVYHLAPSYRRLARRNLRIAFGREKEDAEIAKMTREVFSSMGANFVSSIRFASGRLDDLKKTVTIEGAEAVIEACDAGRGAVCVVAHAGPWEILSLDPGVKAPGREVSAIYQALGNPLINDLVLRRRQQAGVELLDRKVGFNRAGEILRGGGVVGILADQHAGDAGMFIPFMGRLASTTNLPALMAKRAGADVFTTAVRTVGTAKWVLSYEKIEPYGEVNGRAWSDLDAMTYGVNLGIEKVVRRSPADWFWVHNRWKTPDPAFLLTRHKRGVKFPPGMDPATAKPFRVVMRSPNWLGDACMAMPAVRAIKRGRPDVELTMIAPAKFADIWNELPEVDHIIPREGKDSPKDVAKKLLAKGTFDAGILLTNSPRTAMEMWHADVRRIVGYRAKWRSFFLNQFIPHKVVKNGPPLHHVEHYMQMAHRIGGDCSDRTLFDAIPRRDGAAVIEPSAGHAVRIGLCAGAEYGPAKRWPLESFAEMARMVNEKRAEAGELPVEWVLFGAPGEKQLGEDLTVAIGGHVDNLVGKTSIIGLMDHLRSCEFLVSNDTGTMHLAALLGVEAVAIFGSTEPRWTRPLGKGHTILREHVECSPCFLRECPIDFRCMKAITPERVAGEVMKRLG
ncbi:lipopolysaccharide heptosyltransferase II [Sulfuriroseicoccus oceanibius]|uniref:lipopolysaccharide heptosyltransferase II n=1 Tax=Sulfuriroseicoccus oceanibius TaxID=2707525 RepID=A0A6B3LEG8_9BACT|nr:lipopolysaccharide heptosyltransferase II [Sulfuriroseicoccus oceanibius]QQL46027.1 lipopolysaccharide heptosyltransferase II [Sulfuriroseicoccus oceanibius]